MNKFLTPLSRVPRTNDAVAAWYQGNREFHEKSKVGKWRSCRALFVGRFFKLLVNDV